jgi:hypothetical protein
MRRKQMSSQTSQETRWPQLGPIGTVGMALPLGAVAVVVFGVLAGAGMRGADPVELLAVGLFLPVLLAVFVRGARGGLVAAIVATALYGAVRARDTDVLGAGRVAWLVLSRGIALVLFGGVGGWAFRAISTRPRDEPAVDHDTGLSNSVALGEWFDLEAERAKRYARTLSVVRVSVPLPSGKTARERRDLLADLGSALRTAVRTVDRIGIVRWSDHVELTALLPETSAQGAERVAARVAYAATSLLGSDVAVTQQIHWVVHSTPNPSPDTSPNTSPNSTGNDRLGGGDDDFAAWRASLLRVARH